MNIVQLTEVLGNVGEFVGAIAVVLTLFYLAVQVKHSKEATEANTRSMEEDRKVALAQAFQTRASETANSLRILATSPIAAIQLKYEKSGLDSLDDEERFRLFNFHMNNANRFLAAHYHYEQGLLPDYWPGFKVVANSYRKVWRDLEVDSYFESTNPKFHSDLRQVWAEQDQVEEAR